MKKLIIILIFLSHTLFSVSYNNYPMVSLKVIQTGSSENELGYEYDPGYIFSGGPQSFAIDETGDVYIADTHNKRMAIYDEDINFKRILNVDGSSTVYYSSSLEINKDRIYGRDQESTFYIISDKGDNLFQYGFGGTELFNQLKTDKFIWIDSVLFHHLADGEVIAIENQGSEYSLYDKREIKDIVMGVSVDADNVIFRDGEIQTKDFLTFINHMDRNLDHANGFSYDLFFKMVNNKYLGADNHQNRYWKVGSKRIIVFNGDDRLIDSFLYDHTKSDSTPAIHPDGSIYFMKIQAEQIEFFKITRQW
ncbi:hypothetical protein [Spirochaeta isovalerica]|uniref:NHL repeat containing protein n=1 Tax=Spirochaeta isovalerica TaxID=150 RepID=A0A841RCW1_9SPIO|nr:hypothetical protein [Spirochaeta isovalerica]MBB6481231.1 hypothetical protein [Spirochaeta isovalerica]